MLGKLFKVKIKQNKVEADKMNQKFDDRFKSEVEEIAYETMKMEISQTGKVTDLEVYFSHFEKYRMKIDKYFGIKDIVIYIMSTFLCMDKCFKNH